MHPCLSIPNEVVIRDFPCSGFNFEIVDASGAISADNFSNRQRAVVIGRFEHFTTVGDRGFYH